MRNPEIAIEAAMDAVDQEAFFGGLQYTGHVIVSHEDEPIYIYAQEHALGREFMGDYAIEFPIEALSEGHAYHVLAAFKRALYECDFTTVYSYLSTPETGENGGNNE